MSEFDNNGYETTEQTYASYGEVENPSKAFAITSLVLGIVSIPFICCTWIGLIIAVAGLVFGILSLTRKENGRGMAIAGIVCSSIAAVVIIVILIYAATQPQMSASDIEELTRQLQDLFK